VTGPSGKLLIGVNNALSHLITEKINQFYLQDSTDISLEFS
jgi:hypothetical protein